MYRSVFSDLIVFVDADDPNLGCINTECPDIPKGQKMEEKLKIEHA